MAKVLYSGLVSQLVNALGSNVFFRNRTGDVVRARITPPNPQSGAQTTIRNAWKQATSEWSSTLTQAQRDGWQDLADRNPWPHKLTTPRPLTGQQLWCRCRIPNLQFNVFPLSYDPPPYLDVEQPLTFTINTASISLASLQLELTYTPQKNGYVYPGYLTLSSGPPTTAGRKCGPFTWKILTTILTTNISFANWYDTWSAAYGTPTAGTRLHLKIKIFAAPTNWGSKTIRTSAIWEA
jgi:hypothetical protein